MAGNRKKAFVGLSGGVDSSVSAALLQKAGYDVVGVFIKVWQADFLPCTWREERRDAMRVAAHLGIPFLTLDLEKEYKTEVVDYMIREYAAGRIPNPDVMCNKHVKFGAFLDFAKQHGADFVATGHYARISRTVLDKNHQGRSLIINADKKLRLFAGLDKEKDQSYFLWTLTHAELAHTLFPVGLLKKVEVRRLAKRFKLPNAEKKDSQGLCFMGAVDVADFLKHYVHAASGDVLDTKGNVIGRHDGALLYTIGQRHGFTTMKSSSNEAPYFVVAKNMERNTVTVAHRDHEVITATKQITLNDINDPAGALAALISPHGLSARIRYRGELFPLRKFSLSGTTAVLELEEPVDGVASGQSLVIYRKDEILGGGVINLK